MKKIILIVVLLGIVAAGWYLLSPLFINSVVDEELPVTFSSQRIDIPPVDLSEGDYDPKSDQVLMEEFAGMPDVVMNESMVEVSEPETSIQTVGNFIGADAIHSGEGEVKIITNGSQQFLRFENFSVTNGPDLFVTLNKGDSPKSEHVIISGLKGNKGDQNYDISEYDLSEYESVSVYCRAFSVEFATALLEL